MIRHPIVITVAGHPQPKGSLKCIGTRGGRGHVLIEDNKGTKPWRRELVSWMRQTKQRGAQHQPLTVEITSTLSRPKSHYGTGRNTDRVRDTAPPYPTGHATGDVDKLARLVLDALQDSGILDDDAQVIEVTSRKTYVDNPSMPDALTYPGVVIRVDPYQP